MPLLNAIIRNEKEQHVTPLALRKREPLAHPERNDGEQHTGQEETCATEKQGRQFTHADADRKERRAPHHVDHRVRRDDPEAQSRIGRCVRGHVRCVPTL
jgi:hypothetical protein